MLYIMPRLLFMKRNSNGASIPSDAAIMLLVSNFDVSGTLVVSKFKWLHTVSYDAFKIHAQAMPLKVHQRSQEQLYF